MEALAEAAERRLVPEFKDWLESVRTRRLRIMVHGGNVERTPPVAPHGGPDQSDFKTKRQQIAMALNGLPFVETAFLAEEEFQLGEQIIKPIPTGPAERVLFDAADATIILVELDPRFRGSQSELSMHSAQYGAGEKLFILLPPDIAHSSNGGFFSANMYSSIPANSVLPYSAEDYNDCHLVGFSVSWVESLWVRVVGRWTDQWLKARLLALP